MNVKKAIALAVARAALAMGQARLTVGGRVLAAAMVGALVIMSAACSGDATPTRLAKAPTEAATQTPWIIYIPITTTPEPETATPLPTVTPEVPEPTATRTRAPATARPAATRPPPTQVPPTAPPSPEAPTATPQPSCGQTFSVQVLLFPENGTKRQARAGSGAGKTIQFRWELISSGELDPRIGYRVNINSPRNRQALYISHNEYLRARLAILNQQATYGLTQGDDTTAEWNVEVIMTSGEFNDQSDDTTPPLGTIATCGPVSPTFTIELEVQE